jgi:hypothetical protein
VAKDILGRPIITAAQLDEMTWPERQAAFDASIVTDLSLLPEDFVAELRAGAEQRLAAQQAAQQDIPHAS